MLEIRQFKESEVQQIEDILLKEKINDLELNKNTIVVVEDRIVLGVCRYVVENDNSWLKYLIVKENNRGELLGDGLLRTVLNKLDLQGVKRIYYSNIDTYLIKKGFKENDKGLLELNISEFFSVGCKCSGNCNEI